MACIRRRPKPASATLDRLGPDWALRGIGVRLHEVVGGTARIVATAGGNGPIDAAALRAEIEAVIVEAAPDLDDIIIEGLSQPQFALAAADG
jgi:hypothetical protein